MLGILRVPTHLEKTIVFYPSTIFLGISRLLLRIQRFEKIRIFVIEFYYRGGTKKTNPKSGQIGGPSRADRGAVITPPPVVCSYQGPSPWRRGVSRVGLAILVVLEARNGGWCSGPVLL